jgi:hypothetical protein
VKEDMNESLEAMTVLDQIKSKRKMQIRSKLNLLDLKGAINSGVPFKVHPKFSENGVSNEINFEMMKNDLNELETPTPTKKRTNFKKSSSIKTKPITPITKTPVTVPVVPKKTNRKFIFFLVHGLEATSFDMRQIRASIISNIPNASVCLIQKNNELTNNSIESQGKRLADEILNLIESKNISGKN